MTRKFNAFYCTAIVALLCLFSQQADAGMRRTQVRNNLYNPAISHSSVQQARRAAIKTRSRIRTRRITAPQNIGTSLRNIGMVAKRNRTAPKFDTSGLAKKKHRTIVNKRKKITVKGQTGKPVASKPLLIIAEDVEGEALASRIPGTALAPGSGGDATGGESHRLPNGSVLFTF